MAVYNDIQWYLNVVDCYEVTLDGEQEDSRLPKHFLQFVTGASYDAPQGQEGDPSLEQKQRALREWRSLGDEVQLEFLKGLKGASRVNSPAQSEVDQNEADHQPSRSDYPFVEAAGNIVQLQDGQDELDDAHSAAAADHTPPIAMLPAGAADADSAPDLADAPVHNPPDGDQAVADADSAPDLADAQVPNPPDGDQAVANADSAPDLAVAPVPNSPDGDQAVADACLLYTSPSPRD